MKTKVAAIYGKRDVRLREFELPEITDNELLVSVISDSVCLSTWKAALLGSEHKRVPDDLENHPVITGHECAGVIVEVGKNLTGKYKKGQRFVLQPAMGLPSGYSAGYSYEYFGGNATYMIIPEIAINLGCVLPYHGSYFAAASLAELMTLSGIGQTKAQAVVNYRDAHGGFSSVEEIMNVDGIKEGLYNRIRDQIKVK